MADLTNYVSYGPARASGVARVSDESKGHLPTIEATLAKGLRQSARFWSDYGDQLHERFNAWLAAN